MSDSSPPAGLGSVVLWRALVEQSGAAVCIIDRDGNILQANARSRAWMEGCRPQGSSGGEPYSLDDTCAPSLREERLAIIRRVCETGEPLVYESINRGIRHLITLNPFPAPDGAGFVALSVARRLRPWERVTPERFPDFGVVHVKHHDPGPLAKLSPRELDVLILIGEGLAYSEVAARLHRSVRTVERHRDRLGQKLGVNSRVELARFAIRAGLAELPNPADEHSLSTKAYDPLDVSEAVRAIVRRRRRRTE